MKKIIAIGILLTLVMTSMMVTSADSDEEQEEIYYTVMSDMGPRPEGNSISYDTLFKGTQGDSPIPGYFNWKDKNGQDWTTPAKYQGSCGSCWAFAAIGAFESQINIVNGDPNYDVDLSEQYILSCLPSAGSCAGGWAQSAFNRIISTAPVGNGVNGLPLESCMPYQATSSVYCEEKCDDWMDGIHELHSYVEYKNIPQSSEGWDFVKQLLIEQGPMVTYMSATSDLGEWGSVHHDPNDWFELDPATNINHAVTLVGWKDDPEVSNGGYWIIKNSWGQNWGYEGFFNIAYGSKATCEEVTVANVEPDIIVDFEWVPTLPDKDNIVSFTSIITGNPVSYWWDFDNGYYSSVENPKHTFYENGTYIISLTVVNDMGITSTKTKAIAIPITPINANFEVTPEYPLTNEEVQFTDLSTGSVVNHLWDFGDGITSTIENPVHVYNDLGIYTVSLEASGFGYTDIHITTLEVLNRLPIADFTFSSDALTGSFFDASSDPDGTIESYFWQFGDGSTSILQNPTHDYSNKGTYNVTLTVTDNDGGTNSVTYPIDLSIPDLPDAEAEQHIYGFAMFLSRYGAQSFKPNVPNINNIEVKIGRGSRVTTDLEISILEDDNGSPGNAIYSTEISKDEVSTTISWFDINTDISVTPGDTYYLQLRSVGGSATRYYTWGFGEDTYDLGIFYFTSTDGYNWIEYPQYDLCFKINS